MTTVFIGGSRHITRLTSDVRARLDRIVSAHLPVVVGDASGADKAVQGDLAGRHYANVEVFCSDESPRNNLGGWPVRVVRPTRRVRESPEAIARDHRIEVEDVRAALMYVGELAREQVVVLPA